MISDKNCKTQTSITTLLHLLTITKLWFLNNCKKLNSFIFWGKKKGLVGTKVVKFPTHGFFVSFPHNLIGCFKEALKSDWLC